MKSKVVIIVAVVIIIILAIVLGVFFIGKNGGSVDNNSNNPTSSTGEVVKYTDNNIPIPEGYSSVKKENITSETSCVAEAVFYKEESGDKTLVKVHLQNRGEDPFNKNAVCVISFFDANGNLLHRIGGVIEEGKNIPAGGTTIINTQFLAKAGPIAKATIGFEKM